MHVAKATATAVNTGSDTAIVSGAATYRGFSLRNTSGAAVATVRIYDGTSGTGTLLDTIQLAASESRAEFYDAGVTALVGIFVKLVAGAIEGSVRWSA